MATSYRRIGGTLLVVAALTAAACSSAASTSSSKANRTLVVLTPEIAEGLNPDGPTAADAASLEAIDNLYGTLIYYNSSGTQGGVVIPDYSSYAPRLATSWTHVGNTWTFHLRQGVKSCSGNTLTAQDIVYTYQRAMAVAGATPVNWFLGNISGVLPVSPVLPNATAADKQLHGEVVALNSSTVQIKQMYPDALFPLVEAIGYTGIFDAKTMKAHATASDPWSEQWSNSGGSAGFGPYCLGAWTPGQSITYHANPGYYLHPYYTTVIDKAVPEDANRIASIESGAAQIVTGLTPQEFSSVQSSGQAQILSWQSNQNIVVEMNYQSKPWSLPNNKLIRQAVAYAIPYDEIISSVFKGTAHQMLSPVPPGYNGYHPVSAYSTNLAKAKALLAQAGYPGGRGLNQYTQGLQLSYQTESSSILQPIATMIQTALAKIGIHITLNPITAAEFSTLELTKHSLPFGLDNNEHPIGTDADYTAKLYFQTTSKGGLSNNTNYSSPVVDSLFAKALTMPTGPARDAVLAQLQDTLMTDLPWIPLVVQRSQIAVAKGITGWLGNPDTTLNYWNFTKS